MEIKGLNSVISDIRKLSKEVDKDVEAITEQVARNIEKDAKMTVVADDGKAGQSIMAVKLSKSNWAIYAGGVLAPYVPYIEFGTGGLVDVPAELKEIAIRFKGKGIKQVNLRARPFLYPAYLRGGAQYIDKLKKLLEKYGKVK